MSNASSTTPVPLILLAWAVVAAPLGWGLYQSVVKSRPLFLGDPVAATATSTASPGPAASHPQAGASAR